VVTWRVGRLNWFGRVVAGVVVAALATVAMLVSVVVVLWLVIALVVVFAVLAWRPVSSGGIGQSGRAGRV
jgi:hypothetical protein